MTTTHQHLSDLMDFGLVVAVTDGGRAKPMPLMRGPEEVQYLDLDASGSITGEPEAPAGWEYLRFLTGEHGIGPTGIMHPSNVIPGGIAERILSEPGYYVAVTIDGFPIEYEPLVQSVEAVSVGWGVLHYVGN